MEGCDTCQWAAFCKVVRGWMTCKTCGEHGSSSLVRQGAVSCPYWLGNPGGAHGSPLVREDVSMWGNAGWCGKNSARGTGRVGDSST
eukprot:15348693-Ditylum_brightwellii.AAC.1